MTWWDPMGWLRRPVKEERVKTSRRARSSGARDGRGWRRWVWPIGAVALILVVHVLALPVTPRVSSDLPEVGEVAENEVRAPFDFSSPLLERDVEMRQLQRVLVEPPVMERIAGREEVLSERLAGLRQEWVDLSGMPRNEQIGVLTLRHPELDTDDLQRLVDLPDSTDFFRLIEEVAVGQMAAGIVDELPPGNYRKVRVLDGGSETTVDLESLVNQEQVHETVVGRLEAAGYDSGTAVWGARLLRPMMPPNMIFSPETTRSRRLAASSCATCSHATRYACRDGRKTR